MSCWHVVRRCLLLALLLALASGCGGDAERAPRGQGGGASLGNAGASGGNAGTSGASGGRAGQGGLGPFDGTPSSGCRYLDHVGTTVTGQGFSYPDGTGVHAIFGARTTQTAIEPLRGGAFEVTFYEAGYCTLGVRYVPAALFIDVDGDGVCRLAVDRVFVWLPSGGASGTNHGVLVAPDSPHCPAWLPELLADDTVATVRQLCPEIGSCLPFCEPASSPRSDENSAACARGDAGAADGGGDAAVPDAAVADASL